MMSLSQNIESLLGFLDRSPTPFHAVESVVEALGSEYVRYEFGDTDLPESGFMRVDGTLLAWRLPSNRQLKSFRVIGAHTDSPTLRIRPRPDDNSAGIGRIGVEVYGGVLLNSWLDRDLGVAGQVVMRDGSSFLIHSSGAVARIPQLAIHLDRDVNDQGLVLDRHSHLQPIWCTLPGNGRFVDWIGDQLNTNADSIASWSLSLFDISNACLLGADNSFLSSGRIDNLLSCWAAASALSASTPQEDTALIVALFDHEEVGSDTLNGASGPLLNRLIEMIGESCGSSKSDLYGSLGRSLLISTDNAHGVHPNYPERHDANNAPYLNRGVAVKINESQRYASTPQSVRSVLSLFENEGLNPQVFVSRNNIACGSTIGPITSTRVGIPTVDIGVPQLSMHSAREICGVKDAIELSRLLGAHMRASS